MSNLKIKVKKGDNVKISAGGDNGTTGKVVAVLTKKSQVIVEGGE